MFLYPIILISFGIVFVQAARKKLPGKVAVPFAINLVANLLFMPIFAGLRNVPLAAADVLIAWATLVWCVVAVLGVGGVLYVVLVARRLRVQTVYRAVFEDWLFQCSSHAPPM